ncbi:hypothetical protein Nepgr_000397 [Nepenthes gracilis]|uniref:C2H2-type domain-containing protein n=1 Tax=Nepenthes gracilis TaxID=150966 RepID=A0AAD3P3G2_NEPGR|nr:hypothetical protein Nepgr_000397 [Nepenthes gracilis]
MTTSFLESSCTFELALSLSLSLSLRRRNILFDSDQKQETKDRDLNPYQSCKAKMAEEAISNDFIKTLVGSNPSAPKRKRNLPGNPDPGAEVIALSPSALLATNRFFCEICGKGFRRDQNLQLHRRGHNLPWKLKQRSTKEPMKRVYVCPENTCVHHHPSRALGDLSGIKKHFCRKHGEKKWRCEKCDKSYAVQSDWKAHSKTCGTREYKCDCGTIFSRRDGFITHRAFCNALAEETERLNVASHCSIDVGASLVSGIIPQHLSSIFRPLQGRDETEIKYDDNPIFSCSNSRASDGSQLNWVYGNKASSTKEEIASVLLPLSGTVPSLFSFQHQVVASSSSAHMSATALLQKAAEIGSNSADPLFLENLGIKSNCNSIVVEDGKKYSGVFASNSTRVKLGSDLEISVDEPERYGPAANRQKILGDRHDSTGRHSRDFLGVNIESGCRSSSTNGRI